MNEVEVLEKPEIITPRKLRAQKIASGVIEGKTYEQIANDAIPHATAKRQALYESLQSNYVQDEIRAILKEIDVDAIDERVIAANVAKLAFHSKSEAIRTKNLETLAKWKAMLTEKRENTNRQTFETSKELKGIETKDLILELEARLKLSSQGVNTSENVKKA